MSHATLVRRCANLLFLSATVAVLLATTNLVQAQDAPEQRFNEHLQAGEFGVAQRMARQATEPAARDRLLAQVAAAQARAGARRAALGSLADLSDESARAAAAQQVRSAGATPFARGGAAMADFEPLIELLQTTVAPDSWDAVGGPGAIAEFAGGVMVDPNGLMKRTTIVATGLPLADLREAARHETAETGDVRRRSPLRKVSLTRLEKQLQLKWAAGESADDEMRALAGLRRVRYVFVYPETGDIVLAGPAGDWREDHEGRLVGADDGQPVLQLDDLLVTLRHAYGRQPKFGCSIEPRVANLARTKSFLETSASKPLRPGQRDQWLEQLRDNLGQQDIEVFGIDPRTHAARVLVEADYRMKLVGMGLENGTLGVASYLDMLIDAGKTPSDMSMLRWWFTLNQASLTTTQQRDAYSLSGSVVRVLSENELLDNLGQRTHTGKSDEFASRFARGFTAEFEKLAAKYPVYAELRNVFELSLIAALLRVEDLPGSVDWQMTHLLDESRCPVSLGVAPREVTTVVSHRAVDQRRFIAGASGGVSVQPSLLVTRDAIKPDTYGIMPAERNGSTPKSLPRDAWWWD
ncbi:MAG: DUF1598 domain-containing protein [Pirellulaceae bacterium]|nr:DUF1598 domain-containing protein [Planctomycetales bacterium]